MSLKDAERAQIDGFLARKQYDRAIELLERLYAQHPEELTIKMKLADAYFLYGKNAKAVKLLSDVAEFYAKLGFVTKAMAVQKKMLRIDPGTKVDIYSHVQEERAAPMTAKRKAPTMEQMRAAVDNSAFKILDNMFAGLSKDEFEDVFKLLKEKAYTAGEVIFRELDESNSLFIIASGSVKVFTSHRGSELELATLQAGSFFGEVALLTGNRRTATVRSAEESHLLILDRSDFLTLSERYPKLRATLESALEQRARSTVETILDAEKKGTV